jgi:hypothetical protein
LLFLIHPAGNGDEQENGRVEGPGHRCSVSPSYAARSSYCTLRGMKMGFSWTGREHGQSLWHKYSCEAIA